MPAQIEAGAAADLLTVALSKEPSLTILDRVDVEKVFREQGLSAGTTGVLKLGGLIDAEGLFILDLSNQSGETVLLVRLVAVRPGVVLAERAYRWPVQARADWAGATIAQFRQLFSKLDVPLKNALPISVLNLRSSLATSEAKDQERDMTRLLIHRLILEPEIFVLERRQLRDVVFEKDLNHSEESPFWNGCLALEGTLDRDGYNPAVMTIDTLLIPAQGGNPISIEVTGARASPVQLVDSLVAKILSNLRRNSAIREWQPEAEADRYFEEAAWAHRWGVMRQAQQAAESAWALGKHTRECALVRLRSYVDDSWGFRITRLTRANWNYFSSLEIHPQRSELDAANRAIEIFLGDTSRVVTNKNFLDREWSDAGLRLLDKVGGLLEEFYYVAEAREGNVEQLQTLRERTRKMVELLATFTPPTRGQGSCVSTTGSPSQNCRNLWRLKWEDAALWVEKPEQAFEMQRRIVEEGFRPYDLPFAAAWAPGDRKRIPLLLKRLIEDLSGSPKIETHLEGLYLALALAPNDPEGTLQTRESALLAAIWENRNGLFGGDSETSIFERTEWLLRQKHDYQMKEPFTVEPFAGFAARLRREYLVSMPVDKTTGISALFPFATPYSKEDAREFLDLLGRFTERLNRPDDPRVTALSRMFKERLDLPETQSRSEPRKPTVSQPPGHLTELELQPVTQFVDWRPNLAGVDFGAQPVLTAMLSRNSSLWFQVQDLSASSKSVFVRLDPRTGSLEAVPFAAKTGYAPTMRIIRSRAEFDVTPEALLISAVDGLHQYNFRSQTWETLPVPMPSGARVAGINGKIYLTTSDSTLELGEDGHTTRILGSARRNPFQNVLDQLGGAADLFPGPGNSLRGRVGPHLLKQIPGPAQWEEIPLFPKTIVPYVVRAKTTETGTWFQLTGFGVRHRLVAAWDDSVGLHPLLEQRFTREQRPVPDLEQMLGEPLWKWPEPYFIAATTLAPEGKALWMLHPSKVTKVDWVLETPLVFADERNATLLHFTSDSSEPTIFPLRFERQGKLYDPYTPPSELFHGPRTDNPIVFLTVTQDSLVLACPTALGHWVIHKSLFNEKAARLRASDAGKTTPPNSSIHN